MVTPLATVALRTALESMERSPDTELDEATAREVAMRAGAAAVVVPSIARVGA